MFSTMNILFFVFPRARTRARVYIIGVPFHFRVINDGKNP